MDLKVTGKFIQERRKAKGLTQAQLAEKISVSEKTVSKWECGGGFPDTSLMLPLCEALEISANELLSGKLLNEREYKPNAEKHLVELKNQQEKLYKHLY
ncbi:MAG: helix-turn-helix transcriptional regulator, partial [Clostridia bacterium]|nr:helix-turn-helix transcriptional regulator [Clostridia bacterium]